MITDLTLYTDLLGDIKTRIRLAQVKATLSANAEMILMYWDIGRLITERQQREGWGAAVIPRLSRDIRNDLPEEKGFSKRNIGYMIRLAHEYGTSPIMQQPVAKLHTFENADFIEVPQAVAQMPPNELSTNLQQLVAKIPWGHNILLMEKVKDLPARLWYMQQTIEQGWSRDTLGQMIKSAAHKRQGEAVTNFGQRLPLPQSDLAGVDMALRRAAKTALKLARQTNTPCYVVKDGKIVDIAVRHTKTAQPEKRAAKS